MNQAKQFCCLLFFLIFALNTEGVASPILERLVTIKAQNLSLGEVFKDISKQADCQFSYNPNIISTEKKVSINAELESVRNVLKNLLGTNFQFKQKGNYLIIQRLKSNEQIISGYVKDKKTGKNLENVTVYDKKSLVSATTDNTGYYEIITRKPIEQLSIARFNYGDTSFQLKSLSNNKELSIDVSLMPKTTSLITEQADSNKIAIKILDTPKDPFAEQTLFSILELRRAVRNSVEELKRINDRNITDDLLRRWHISLAPYVGTNLALSGNVVNDYSFNATVGYSKGNRILEVGAIGNINRSHVRGIQLAGLLNIVGGEMKGVQASSILNRTNSVRGLQIAGVTNYSDKILRGWQIAGVNNYVDFGQGGAIQTAGIINKTTFGRTALQIAGITNQADTVGIQIGLLNNANHVRGFQLGLINIADTASGVLLGILNIVKKGYHVLEFSTNDINHLNVAYRTGIKQFYSIYTFGGQPEIVDFKKNILSGGVGFGTSFWFGKTIGFTLDATAHRFWIENILENRGELLKITPAFNIQVTKKIGIALAPVWNNYYLNSKNQNLMALSRINKQIIPEKAKALRDWRQWWGWSVGIRFF